MLTQFRHYTDDELLHFVENAPGHLAAGGELVRRVVAEEWEQDVRDEEREQLETQLKDAEECNGNLEAQIEELKEILEDVRKPLERVVRPVL